MGNTRDLSGDKRRMKMNNAAFGPTNAAKILIMARIISITREMIPYRRTASDSP